MSGVGDKDDVCNDTSLDRGISYSEKSGGGETTENEGEYRGVRQSVCLGDM